MMTEKIAKIGGKLAGLLSLLAEAQEIYDAAKKEESYARNNATNAYNRLTQLQKEIDTAIVDLRSNSGGDWQRNRKVDGLVTGVSE
jgi:C-terminal processing protease CtpA/Prc